MMDKLKLAKARQNKLNKDKLAKEKADKALIDSILQFQDKTIEKLHDELSVVYDDFKELLAKVDSKDYQQNLDAINNSLVSLIQKFEAGVNVNNIKEVESKTDLIVKNFRDMPKSFKVTNLKDINFDTKGLATDKAIKELGGGLANIANQLGQLDELLQPAQLPENFVPFRRVVKVGNRLQFDDSSWSGASGGGGGSSSSNGLTDAQLRATPVDVALTTGDIEIGAVELKNGTDDTRATITATNALKVDGSAVTQPVSGTITANAGTNLNTSALALETGGNLASVATNTTNIPNAIGTAASAIPSKLVQVGGSDGTNARAIKTNTSGQLDVRPLTSSDNVTVANSSIAVTQGTATNLKAQAETYQGGTAVSSSNPLQVTLANTGANSTAVKVDGSAVTQPVSQAAPTTIYNGKKTVTTAGTRVTLASSTTVKSVTIKALSTNTGLIYVGDTSVASTNGFQLSAGETISMDIANLNTVNLDSSVSGESVTYIGVA